MYSAAITYNRYIYCSPLHICYPLQYTSVVRIVVEAIYGYDAKGVDVYVLSEIWCDGTEDRLLECGHSDFVYSVCETNGAGVKCLSGG